MADRNWKTAPPAPTGPIQKTLKLRAGDEALVQGLGAALVLQWDAIPDAIQDLLIDQAAIVLEDAEVQDAESRLETLIRSAKAAPLTPKK